MNTANSSDAPTKSASTTSLNFAQKSNARAKRAGATAVRDLLTANSKLRRAADEALVAMGGSASYDDSSRDIAAETEGAEHMLTELAKRSPATARNHGRAASVFAEIKEASKAE